MRTAGICGVVLLALMLAVNAAFMLASPRAWFQLPTWFKMTGSLSEHQYATGWGAVQVRITGGLVIAVIMWVAYDIFSK